MKACCFIGHRNVEETKRLCDEIRKTVAYLIEEHEVQYFFFGSASKFDSLCLKIVREMKSKYSGIQLVYVRSSYRYIDQLYKDYLLETYDDTIMPSGVDKAGKATYVERNQAMIDASAFCVFYYDEQYKPPMRKQSKRVVSSYQPQSGTKLAFEYATRRKKPIINLYR